MYVKVVMKKWRSSISEGSSGNRRNWTRGTVFEINKTIKFKMSILSETYILK